ncbi:hypothetical protein VNO77_19973 [Canavalia gladiata]|uniref:Uncharacterized protein n=1 Tax=Canavalia gladiata TaxID=3824 RepID=A0AAN9LNP4_CANGL
MNTALICIFLSRFPFLEPQEFQEDECVRCYGFLCFGIIALTSIMFSNRNLNLADQEAVVGAHGSTWIFTKEQVLKTSTFHAIPLHGISTLSMPWISQALTWCTRTVATLHAMEASEQSLQMTMDRGMVRKIRPYSPAELISTKTQGKLVMGTLHMHVSG